MLSIGAALSVFVYVGATAIDARVGTLASTVQSALQADAQFEPGDVDSFYTTDSGILDDLVFWAFLLLLVGTLKTPARPMRSLFPSRRSRF